MLTSWTTVPVLQRQSVVVLLDNYVENVMISRDIEASIHAICRDISEYSDKCQQIILNLKQNHSLAQYGSNLVVKSDSEMSQGTIIEDIERESSIRRDRFESMLQEKYDMMNDKSYNTTLKCRRCGSAEVSWEQKQTRSADEASTVFCTCNKCNNRWTMR
tara:strand:- start:424 stop:903 length:480 start_codon:yes stop_codon:yes gene_type:complete